MTQTVTEYGSSEAEDSIMPGSPMSGSLTKKPGSPGSEMAEPDNLGSKTGERITDLPSRSSVDCGQVSHRATILYPP